MKSACVGVLSIIELKMHGETLKFKNGAVLCNNGTLAELQIKNEYVLPVTLSGVLLHLIYCCIVDRYYGCVVDRHCLFLFCRTVVYTACKS